MDQTSSFFVLSWIHSLIQEQVILASKSVTTSMTNGEADIDASELLKEKVYFLDLSVWS
jgi:hypothetical protein